MTRGVRSLAGVPLLLAVACQNQASTLLDPDFAKAGGKTENTPLTAVYRDALGDGVTSDARLGQANPTYIDGVDGVEAVILIPIGNFRMMAKSPSPRKLCIDFGTQAPPLELGQPWCDNGYQTSSDANITGGLPAMTVGQTMTSTSQVTWVAAGFNWLLRFGRDCSGDVVSPNRVSITRVDANTWSVESPSGSSILCKMPISGRPLVSFVGTYTIAFQLTLRPKQ